MTFACRNCRRPLHWMPAAGWLHGELPQYAHEPITCQRPEPALPVHLPRPRRRRHHRSLTMTHTRTHVYVSFANPYLVCDMCLQPAPRWHNNDKCGCEQECWLDPCRHNAEAVSVCPSWNPVDGCCCQQVLGSVDHATAQAADAVHRAATTTRDEFALAPPPADTEENPPMSDTSPEQPGSEPSLAAQLQDARTALARVREAVAEDQPAPAEHCGHLSPATLLTTPRTECALPPGHHGSHADDRGCRWWYNPSAAETAAPDAGLREEYAAAMREHWLVTTRDAADGEGRAPCRCGDWHEPGPMDGDEYDWDSHLADAILTVRDRELQQLRADCQLLSDQADEWCDRAVQAEAALKRVRDLATVAAANPAAGLSDYRIGRHDLAVDILDTLDQTSQEQPEPTVDRTTATVFSALYRSAEQTVTRVIDLAERWADDPDRADALRELRTALNQDEQEQPR